MIFKQVDEILTGRKTQTRRVVKPGQILTEASWRDFDRRGRIFYLPIGVYIGWHDPGDKWIGRAIYVIGRTYAVVPKRGLPAVWWRADGDVVDITRGLSGALGDAHRYDRKTYLTVEGYQEARIRITAIRQESLQDISEADARAEGVGSVEEYRALWERINGKTKGARWADNPAVWVLEFELVRDGA